MARKKKEEVKIRAFKGFEHDWTCRGFKYEVGKTYEQKGNIKVCSNGFHACEEPLKVLQYYLPCDDKGNLRKFAEVEQSGKIAKDDDKTASSKINIKAELSIFDLAKLQVEYVKERCNDIKENSGYGSAAVSSGDRSAAVNSGYRSAAVNSGNRSAAVNSGYGSAAVNSGDGSAAVSSGYWSAAVNSGYGSAAVNSGDGSAAVNSGNGSAAVNSGNGSSASVEKENSAAFAFGYQSKARAKDGWIIIVDWREDENDNRYIENIYSAKVGGKIKNKVIKSNVWYWFEDGKLKSEKEI